MINQVLRINHNCVVWMLLWKNEKTKKMKDDDDKGFFTLTKIDSHVQEQQPPLSRREQSGLQYHQPAFPRSTKLKEQTSLLCYLVGCLATWLVIDSFRTDVRIVKSSSNAGPPGLEGRQWRGCLLAGRQIVGYERAPSTLGVRTQSLEVGGLRCLVISVEPFWWNGSCQCSGQKTNKGIPNQDPYLLHQSFFFGLSLFRHVMK